ncbi:MAG TPA: hypothetical protein VGE40_02645 [Bacilli bacterium]
MFKNKFFLNGLGIGLIVGAILLQIMIYADKPLPEQGNVPEDPMDETELVEAVEKLGYSVIKKDLTSTPSPQEKTDITPVPALTSSPSPVITQSPSPSKEITVIIPRGSGSEAVGNLLFKSKVISNVDEFVKAVENRKLTNKIQSGSFSFTGKETLNEILKIITTVQ